MKIPNTLIEKYFSNRCTPREARRVLRWFKTAQGQEYLKHRIDVDIQTIEQGKVFLPKLINTCQIQENIFNHTEEEKAPTAERRSYSLYLKWAASLALIALSAILFVQINTEAIVYNTSFGEKRQIVLPDSSNVILNGNSTIRMLKDWGESKREVWLEGEAFFSVVHTQNNSEFVVHANDDFQIRVLGTEFNVTNYHNITKIALEKGKVQLSFIDRGKQSTLTMKPGEVVEYNRSSAYLIKKDVPNAAISSWKEENMVFNETSLAEIARMLKSTHGMQLIVDDPTILEMRISGSVPNHNLDLFLTGLEEILNVEIVREQNLIYVNKRNKNFH